VQQAQRPERVARDRDEDGIVDRLDACPNVYGFPSPNVSRNGCPRKRGPADSDGDGIADEDDACVTQPGVPSADSKRHGCPQRDTDSDGVMDGEDACPREPGIASNNEDMNGCPPPTDSDGDGIADQNDACPDQAGPVSSDPEQNGCARARVSGKQIVILDRIEFETDKATIRPESDPILRAVLEVLNEQPDIQRLRVEGHTDNRGSVRYNIGLSKRRARAVVDWLVDRGIDRSRLVAEGVGPNRPIANNNSEEGRQLNRRVEFHIVD
jgi:outer membrane protein OmpA-like peptidoglycan-associated protein